MAWLDIHIATIFGASLGTIPVDDANPKGLQRARHKIWSIWTANPGIEALDEHLIWEVFTEEGKRDITE